MKRLSIFIKVCGVALCLLLTLFQMPAISQTVREFEEALTPAGDSAQRTRGLGGVQSKSAPPQKSMNLNFELDSANLTESAKAVLQQLGQALQKEKLREYVFRLEGHTCDLGEDAHNMSLSRDRALAVKRYLIQNFGLSDEQLQVTWFGESQPAVPNIDETGREKNRRVVIINTLETLAQAESAKGNALQIRRLKDGQETLIADGEAMGQDDAYALEFKTGGERYIYIYQKDSGDKLTPIFPNPQVMGMKNPLEANAFYRMPEQGKWFFLDENKGGEEIFMIASNSPIQDPIATIRNIVSNKMYASNTRGLGGIYREEGPDGAPHIQKTGSPQSIAQSKHEAGLASAHKQTPADHGSASGMRVFRRSFNHE